MGGPGERDNRQSSGLMTWLVLAIVMLPVFYVLLSGPAVWLFQHGYLRSALPIVYKPLIWLEMSDTALGRLLAWYWSFWK